MKANRKEKQDYNLNTYVYFFPKEFILLPNTSLKSRI